MRFGIELYEAPGCCGVTLVTGFSWEWTQVHNPEIESTAPTSEEAYKALFNELVGFDPTEDDWGKVFQIWFQKNADYAGNFEDQYLAEPLRLLVEQIPNVVNLGEFVNHKSGNKIQGYQWEQTV